jgi:catechol 2,3-dioxygenase-like lactoylglutathione lyase family enzyme
MAFHHVALAVKDIEATHRFYTEAMGFTLTKVDAIPSENPGGWAKHLFYDAGDGQLIAFWDLHDSVLPDFDPAISTGQGLPAWVNHLAFAARDDEHYRECLDRWLDFGIDVVEIDHDWCKSIYATDPSGTLVEWCILTRALTDDDRDEAQRMLADPSPALVEPKMPVIHFAAERSVAL